MERKKGILLRVRGRVQGVFYRAFVKRAVSRHFPGLSGYVRNMPDGSVEIFISGKREDMERFISFLKNNRPPLARVDNVEREEGERICGEEFTIVS